MQLKCFTRRFRFAGRRGQRGDTIVEVLISITVLSLILGGAYVTTNHSLQDTRDAQERSNATKLIEAQLEQLRSAAVTNSDTIFAPTLQPFCMTGGSDTPATLPNSSCVVDSTGNPAAAGTQPQYALQIVRTSTTAGGLQYYTFTAKATWDSLVVSGKDTVQMSYRVNAQ